jgi:acetyl esterase/lipase
MSYRPGSEVPWPAQPRDVTAAFAWIKTRIGSRGGNPEQIFLVGHSSGGLLVATVATDSTFLKEWNLSLRDIAGCVPMGTLLTAEPVERTWSPDRLASLFATNSYMKLFRTPEIFNTAHNPVPLAESPAFLILVAEGEREQPPILASAETFTASVIKAGGHGAFEILPERTHRTTIFLMTTPDDTTVQRIVKFINDTMAP